MSLSRTILRNALFATSLWPCMMQAQTPGSLIRGHLNGSYEGLAQYYLRDARIGAVVPQDRFGTNSFLKLDYTHGGFSGGLQFESYLPPILGFYPVPVKAGSKLVNRYVRYAEERFSITAGDFYEQFGSGLILRSWENRQIGINNAIEGIHIQGNPAPWLSMKALYGRTRRFFEHSAAITRGVDAEVDLSRLASGGTETKTRVTLGGSQVGKYQEYTGPVDGFPATVNAAALRFAVTRSDFSIDGEFVSKGPDPHLLNSNRRDKGRAFQLNASWTGRDQGLTASYRTLYNMDFQNERNEEFVTVAPVNYIPALTKQHDLLTSNIYVYAAQFRGESGFQADWFRNFRPRTRWGGKYGMKVNANISSWNGLDGKRLFSSGPRYFSDANIEVRKRWSRKFEGIFHLQHLFYNTSVIRAAAGKDMNGFVAAAGGTWKWKAMRSVRFMFEHLSTREDDGNWAAGLAELSIGNPWLLYVSDLYNYGRTDTHYYNLGFAHSTRGRRFSLSFGRQRPGLFCVGGVCRFVPAAYGFTAGFTTTFSN